MSMSNPDGAGRQADEIRQIVRCPCAAGSAGSPGQVAQTAHEPATPLARTISRRPVPATRGTGRRRILAGMDVVAGLDWAELWRIACGLPRPDAEPAAPPAAAPPPATPAAISPPAPGPQRPNGKPAPPPKARCTAHSSRTGEPCKAWPVRGATVCRKHGGGAPQVRAAAEKRLQEQRAAEVARRGVAGLDLSEFSDPYDALEFAVGYSHALAQRLAGLVDAIPDSELRYQGRISEQLRGEVTAAQAALRDLRQGATDAAKLGLAERRVAIHQQTADMLERALDLALARAGLDLAAQAEAREVFRRNLTVIRGGLAEAGG